MLLTTLLLSTVSANAASVAGFNGGAFVGAQAGFLHAKLKQEAVAKPITKAEADSLYDALNSLTVASSYSALDGTAPAAGGVAPDQAAIDAIKEFDDTTKTATITIKSVDDLTSTDKLKAVFAKLRGFAGLKAVRVVVITDAAGKTGFAARITSVLSKVSDSFPKKEAFSEQLVKADGEQKYSSNNGFAGIHAGYLGRVNDKFLVGGLVEGNWVFGQDMKKDGDAQKDVNARFNVNLFLRALFNMTEKFMVGADIGFSGQEIRQLKAGTTVATGTKAKSSDKESKWFWNPAARLVLGVALTENILATAHFGGVFPMMKQDSLDKSVKAKYSNFHGGVGISYAFGG